MLDHQTQFEAERRYRMEGTPGSQSGTQVGEVSGWVSLQGFLLGFLLTIIGVVAAAVFSSPEKKKMRTGWAIGGALLAFAAAVGASI